MSTPVDESQKMSSYNGEKCQRLSVGGAILRLLLYMDYHLIYSADGIL
jgi:hypothetical protein